MEIDTSNECVEKILNALPFADNDAGLDETAVLIRKLHSENNILKTAVLNISNFILPEDLSNDDCMGLDQSEAIEMAYENVINLAKIAIKNLHPQPSNGDRR